MEDKEAAGKRWGGGLGREEEGAGGWQKDENQKDGQS